MAKTFLWVFGIVFILVGLLGWIPNPVVGMGAIFDTNHVHDLVHLLIGIAFIVVALVAQPMATLAFKVIGGIYLLIALLGFVMVPTGGALLGLVQTNMADHWLHVVLGVVIVGIGFMLDGKGQQNPARV